MKSLVKSLLPPLIFDAYKKIKEKKIVYYSLNDLDKKIEKYLDINNGFFVELGANDGATYGQDYLFKIILRKPHSPFVFYPADLSDE